LIDEGYPMDSTWVTLLGLIAGAITSMGFIPQLVKGYRTKKLDDISYYMPAVLAVGMFLWLIYGIVLAKLPIIAANAFGASCSVLLIVMKKMYS
jgi:MtN3 and saliva related transmembrane protein